MTIQLSNRARWLLALVVLVVAVGGAYGWVAAQDRAYRLEWDRAVEQYFRTEPEDVQASVDRKQAVSGTSLPKPVKTAQILELTTGDLARMIATDVAVSESISPPPRWRARHHHVVQLSQARRSLFELRHEQQQYVAEYLGEAPSLDRMAALPEDPKYQRMADRVSAAVDRAERVEARLIESRPLLAGILSGTLADVEDHDYSRSYSDQVVAELAACARERQRGSTSPELDTCDPSPSEPETQNAAGTDPGVPTVPRTAQ